MKIQKIKKWFYRIGVIALSLCKIRVVNLLLCGVLVIFFFQRRPILNFFLDIPYGAFRDQKGQLHSCDIEETIIFNCCGEGCVKEESELAYHSSLCPNRTLYGRYTGRGCGGFYECLYPDDDCGPAGFEYKSTLTICPEDKPLMDWGGNCYACDDEFGIIVMPSCTEVCPNRVQNNTGYCVLPCTKDKPLMSEYGNCYSCDEPKKVNTEAEPCTEICSNRIETVFGECVLCSSDKPLMDIVGDCYSCDDTDMIYVGYNGQCTGVCPNRIKTSGGECALPCSSDKPLMDGDGNCYSCDDTERIYVDGDGQCTEICPDRIKTSGGECALPCSSDKPLMDIDGNCYSCDDAERIYVDDDRQCTEICPDRLKTEDGVCVFKVKGK
ncbi:MAG: hypothetical protein IKV03_03350 [Alphaproteobacteria bacterium]|nr:hypothetical protein [Alphaproteobacteria bacterium]